MIGTMLVVLSSLSPSSLPPGPHSGRPPTRTQVVVFEGVVELAGAGGALVLRPGEAGEVGPDGRPLFLGFRERRGSGRFRTWILPLEGEIWVEDGRGDRRFLRPGQLTEIGWDGEFYVGSLSPEHLRRLFAALSRVVPPGATVGRFLIPLDTAAGRRFGLDDLGETAAFLSGDGVPSETSPFLLAEVFVDTPIEARASVAARGVDTAALFLRLEEIRIRDLFRRAEDRAEALDIPGVLDLVISGSELEGKPYAFYGDILLLTGRKIPSKVTDVTSIAIEHFITRIRFHHPNRAAVDVVGSAAVTTRYVDIASWSASGAYRFDVHKVGNQWRFGDGDIRTMVIEPSGVTLGEFGIALQ